MPPSPHSRDLHSLDETASRRSHGRSHLSVATDTGTDTTVQDRSRALVTLAQRLADVIPMPPGRLIADPLSMRGLQELLTAAAEGLATVVDGDLELLRFTIGPTIEVGQNPLWRQLLELSADHLSHPRSA